MFDTVEGALDLGVDWLTMFAFSTENWRRPPDEVRYLMHFNEGILTPPSRRSEQQGRAHTLRRPAGLARPASPHQAHGRVDRAHGSKPAADAHDLLQLRRPRRDHRRGPPARRRRRPRQTRSTRRRSASRLYWPDMPDPDVVIRTSGEFRISNFLLWELAYSELVFTDVLWPDFRRENLFDAVGEYQRRDRRYGGLEG